MTPTYFESFSSPALTLRNNCKYFNQRFNCSNLYYEKYGTSTGYEVKIWNTLILLLQTILSISCSVFYSLNLQ